MVQFSDVTKLAENPAVLAELL